MYKRITILILFIFNHLQAQILTRKITNLNSLLNETSGLAYFNHSFYTINDSGNEPEIYKFDTSTGNIIEAYKIRSATNIDWEELTTDDSTIYIGDFGNNNGNRKNLAIYSILKNDLKANTVAVKKHEFVYSNQTNYTPQNRNTSFDCEAFVVVEDSFYLFTKDWINNNTYLYALNKNKVNDTAYLRDSFEAEGLITGACFYKNKLMLLGYSLSPFISFIWQIDQKSPYFGNNKKVKLNTNLVGYEQTEAITSTTSSLFISAEKRLGKAAFYQIHFNTVGFDKKDKGKYRAYPNPTMDEYLMLKGFKKGDVLKKYSFDGKLMSYSILRGNNDKINLSKQSPQLGFIRIFDENGRLIFTHLILKN